MQPRRRSERDQSDAPGEVGIIAFADGVVLEEERHDVGIGDNERDSCCRIGANVTAPFMEGVEEVLD
jgi:hypothetical protein